MYVYMYIYICIHVQVYVYVYIYRRPTRIDRCPNCEAMSVFVRTCIMRGVNVGDFGTLVGLISIVREHIL